MKKYIQNPSKKLLFSFAIVVFSLGAHAQNYKVITRDVEHIKKFTLHLNPWYGEYYGTNSTSGIGWKTEFFFKRFMSFDFTFRSGRYMDISKRDLVPNTNMVPSDGYKKYTGIEPLFTFHLKKKVTTENLHVRLSYTSWVTGNTKYTEEKYTNVEGEVLKVSGLRFGMANVNTCFLINSNNFSSFDASYYDNAIKSYANAPMTNGMMVDSISLNGGYGRMSSFALVLGFSRKKITNVLIDHPTFGKKGHNATQTFFIDFMVGGTSYESIVLPNNTRLDLSAKLKNDGGWRIGYQYKKTNGYGISYSAEMGTRAGYQQAEKSGPGSRFYMQATVGFSLVTPWKRFQ